jgi:hypothetical protein
MEASANSTNRTWTRTVHSKPGPSNQMSHSGSSWLRRIRWFQGRGMSSQSTRPRRTVSVWRWIWWSRRSKRRFRRMSGCISRWLLSRNSFLRCHSISKTPSKLWKPQSSQLPIILLRADINPWLSGCRVLIGSILHIIVQDLNSLWPWNQVLRRWS